jgi:hypothetical protein
MQILHLPPQGTLILIQGGLALLAAAFGVKWLVTRLKSRKAEK